MKKYTHVTIDRRKWYRGKTGENSRLRLKDGTQCCLGFACRMLGLKARDILGKEYPSDTRMMIPGLTESNGTNSYFSNEAAIINDDCCITDQEREKQLKALARENGFIFKFIN